MNVKCYLTICYGQGAELSNMKKNKDEQEMFSRIFQADKDA